MVYLNYKEFKIGKLEFIDNMFVYNSLNGEKIAIQNYVGLVDYNLANSTNLKSDNLFHFFVINFLDKIKDRKDILKKIDIKDKNCYEILKKLCKLNVDKFGFWLSEN